MVTTRTTVICISMILLFILMVGCSCTPIEPDLDPDNSSTGADILNPLILTKDVVFTSKNTYDVSGLNFRCKQTTKTYNRTSMGKVNTMICYDVYTVVKCDERDAILNVTTKECYIMKEECGEFETLKPVIEQYNISTCVKDTKEILYHDTILKYGQKNIECSMLNKDTIICDDMRGKDGNGDGICQSGETCHTYKIEENNIQLDKIKNGNVVLAK